MSKGAWCVHAHCSGQASTLEKAQHTHKTNMYNHITYKILALKKHALYTWIVVRTNNY